VRQATNSVSSEREFSIEEISKKLNTQTFIIERLIFGLNLSSCDENSLPYNKNIAQKLTRVLTSTIDVRTLVFFKMLDENRNQYVGRSEVTHFYTCYLKSITTLNKHVIPQVIEILHKKYHLDTVSLFIL
jgi:hypothetical protein